MLFGNITSRWWEQQNWHLWSFSRDVFSASLEFVATESHLSYYLIRIIHYCSWCFIIPVCECTPIIYSFYWCWISVLCAALSCSVVSDSVWPHGLLPTRLLCPWGLSRQQYWSALPWPLPGDLPNPGIEPRSHSASRFSTVWATRKVSWISELPPVFLLLHFWPCLLK